MSDILIRDVPGPVLAAIDIRATRMGLSRTEYLRRRLAQDAVSGDTVSATQLEVFGKLYADLSNDAVMTGAWD
ncbi:type II toxin-antitoxin system VapB family antitoxin [Arthrobacter sp. A5]|uniref:type II toxin-antitoxin system VapB family antitoxin n=1 Tax=Arthrobacter sp. A5 TaxID=576926 RepID=UPI003DA8B4B3